MTKDYKQGTVIVIVYPFFMEGGSNGLKKIFIQYYSYLHNLSYFYQTQFCSLWKIPIKKLHLYKMTPG
jgi:hypothetical protein